MRRPPLGKNSVEVPFPPQAVPRAQHERKLGMALLEANSPEVKRLQRLKRLNREKPPALGVKYFTMN